MASIIHHPLGPAEARRLRPQLDVVLGRAWPILRYGSVDTAPRPRLDRATDALTDTQLAVLEAIPAPLPVSASVWRAVGAACPAVHRIRWRPGPAGWGRGCLAEGFGVLLGTRGRVWHLPCRAELDGLSVLCRPHVGQGGDQHIKQPAAIKLEAAGLSSNACRRTSLRGSSDLSMDLLLSSEPVC